jgi:AraC-like DNA-binding protein
MAVRNEKLSKTHAGKAVSILFVHDGASHAAGRTERHRHSFWQLEIGIAGTLGVWDAGRSETLLPEHALLLTPGRLHAFSYPDSPVRWATYKFDAPQMSETNTSRRFDAGHLLSPVFSVLADLAPAVGRGVPTEAATATALLEAIYSYVAGDVANSAAGEKDGASSHFVERIDKVLNNANGTSVGIATLAAALNLSAGHVSNRFRQETGRSLKRHIDKQRFSYIKKLLVHSDLPIKLVAHQTGFPDIYAFSRFVKRLSGSPPRAFRRDPE